MELFQGETRKIRFRIDLLSKEFHILDRYETYNETAFLLTLARTIERGNTVFWISKTPVTGETGVEVPNQTLNEVVLREGNAAVRLLNRRKSYISKQMHYVKEFFRIGEYAGE